MFLGVPEMNARLVARFDRDAAAGKSFRQRADDLVFGFPRCIGIEIEHVVVVDTVIDRALGQYVPNRLHQASGDQPRIRQRQPKQLLGNDFVGRILQGGGEELVAVHGRTQRAVGTDVIHRHCEERQRRSNPCHGKPRDGLLRFARQQ